MQPGTDKILAKASAAAVAARGNLARGALDLAAARSFYAMFYTARALLNERGVRARAHAEVNSALRRLHDLPAGFADLPRCFDDSLRRRSDPVEANADEIALWVERGADFATAAVRLFSGGAGDEP